MPANQKGRLSLPCVHEGAILEYCPTCNGGHKHVRECDINGKCTYAFVSANVKSCYHCKDYMPDTSLEAKEDAQPKITRTELYANRDETKRKLLERVLMEQSNMQPIPQPHSALKTRRLLLKRSTVAAQEQRILSDRIQGVAQIPPKSILSVSRLKPDRTTWTVGVTTVPARRETTLPGTLQSLSLSGFPEPRIFIDKQDDDFSDKSILHLYGCSENEPSVPITLRSPNIKTYGNWFLALMELYIRSPLADRYALFQDDIVMGLGVREYLEHCEYPERGYLNLMTFPQNESEKQKHFPVELPEEKVVGWYPSNQKGKSATGFVFNRAVVLDILSNRTLIERFQHERSWQNVDGALSDTMRRIGYVEYVHTPSLIRHTGTITTMGGTHPTQQPLDLSFRGVTYDIMEIVRNLP